MAANKKKVTARHTEATPVKSFLDKDIRQEKFNSKAAIMLEEVKRLKMLIFELEEPLEAFDEKLFLEIVKSIQINKEDEMSVELLGGLRFRERI